MEPYADYIFSGSVSIESTEKSLTNSTGALIINGDVRINSTSQSLNLSSASLINFGGFSNSLDANIGGSISGGSLSISGSSLLSGGITTGTISFNSASGSSIQLSGTSSISNLVVSNFTTNSLSLTNLTATNIINTNLTSGTISFNSASGSSIQLSGTSSISNLISSNITLNSLLVSNGITSNSIYVSNSSIFAGGLTTTTIRANSTVKGNFGFTGGSLYITGSSNLAGGLTTNYITSGNLYITGSSNLNDLTCGRILINSNIIIPNTTFYSITSGTLNILGDSVIQGNLMFPDIIGLNPPTLQNRTSGTRIVLLPAISVSKGDYALGIEYANMWFQVADIYRGYKFYWGTEANVVFATSGNVGIMTTSPSYNLDVVGTIKGDTFTGSSIQLSGRSSISNLVVSNFTTNSLSLTNLTATNITNTNLTSGTISFNNASGSSIQLSGISSISNLVVSNFTTNSLSLTNLTATNITSGTISFNSASGSSIQLSGTSSISNLVVSNFTTNSLSVANLTATNITSGTISFNSATGTNLYVVNFSAGSIKFQNMTGTNISLLSCTIQNLTVLDNLHVSTIKADDKCQFQGNFSIPPTANTYAKTSASMYILGDTIMEGDLAFKAGTVISPTMNGRTSGTRILLQPQTGITQGDYSIGIENNYTWFQVPSNNQGYRFYWGTFANVVFSTSGNVGIMTTSPSFNLDVVGTIKGDIFTGSSIQLSGISSISNLVVSNFTTNSLSLTNLTATNIINTNLTSGTISFNNATGTNLYVVNFSAGSINTSNLSVGNINVLNITTNSLISNNGLTGGSLYISGSSILGSLNIINDTTLNNITCDLITCGGINITGSTTLTDLITTNITIGGINMKPSLGDFVERSATYANNLAQNVLNFVFSTSSCRMFKAIASATVIRSGGNKMSGWDLTGINSNGVFSLTTTLYGTNIGTWSIVGSTGQLRFTSTNETGFSSGTIKFRSQTLSV